jgi:hypothetical protein
MIHEASLLVGSEKSSISVYRMTLLAALLVGTGNFAESWVEAPCEAEQLTRES